MKSKTVAIRRTVDADKRECLTPGARYHTRVSNGVVSVAVDLNKSVEIDEATAIKLENQMHDAMEKILAPFYDN